MSAREHRRQARLQTAGPHREPRHTRPRARVVCHRPCGRNPKSPGQSGLESGRRRPVGSQRSLCRGAHGAHERAERAARQSQRQWWRLRFGSPHWRIRCPHHGHADPRAQGPWPQEGPGHAVHRRRRRHGGRAGIALMFSAGRSCRSVALAPTWHN